MTLGDLPDALKLSAAAGWNQTLADWGLLIALEPERCLALEVDGKLAAAATLVCYETRLAWLGMVLTHPDYRRRGYARSLVSRALELADAGGIETVKLDATEEGIGLYLSLGFEREQPIERWRGTGQKAARPVLDCDGDLKGIAELDRDAFPADRSRLLRLLMARDECFTASGGYLLQRPGSRASYLGPCVARTPVAAERLIRRCLSQTNKPFFWDLLPENPGAVRLATNLGFHPDRRLTRMSRGKTLRDSSANVYAIAGFELG